MSATMRITLRDENGNDTNHDLSVANILNDNIKQFAQDYQKLTKSTVLSAYKRPDFEYVDIED